MDITTTQIGQNFANVQSEATNATLETESQGGAVVDVQARAEAQAQAENQSENSQGSFTQADTGSESSDSVEIERAVDDIQSFVQVQNRNLAFSVDEDTRRSVVTVRDTDSGDVIRQIPSEEVLRLAERLQDLQSDIGSSVGVLFNRQV